MPPQNSIVFIYIPVISVAFSVPFVLGMLFCSSPVTLRKRIEVEFLGLKISLRSCFISYIS